MDYQRCFEDSILRLKAERRSRVFANLERDSSQPRCGVPALVEAPVDVWTTPGLPSVDNEIIPQSLQPEKETAEYDEGGGAGGLRSMRRELRRGLRAKGQRGCT